MIKGNYIGICALVLSNMAFAGGVDLEPIDVAEKNFFVGLGGSYNTATVDINPSQQLAVQSFRVSMISFFENSDQPDTIAIVLKKE